ncbi:glycosyltransferase involved in cell wall biosynthesis [Parabacteroides sp. PF5-5]|uniref:glycosyltransferase n=1 Tax=unclassified Parabacteroides TaxID=2649774 RepID=UPI002473EF06|nr:MULTISPECIES: glycosyltransferase [unclassified Parabacteroides]MDH6306148.1 glycosyltransferase involved in cell wall biosynthesis [Parabacteroides sp. PH5-39]MDH6317107.1 glycosyltransferase involved in cell wall biosynthesis [Parabacteroides sp. PF5-13]MDH6320860.1 glycosyltransferase involved in cell wall biosynthesis [Parabacteroides sp. PH5-13]MDH6324591.1 glycosyltransferase involved in cell wall biosynthesis [Parabacteroides sp. PH5-8]MDH6328358.1 glycosyltransferase involved in cel
MIKVCFIVSSLVNEGPVNVMYNIIKYMDFSRFEVSVITLIPERENSRMVEFRQLPISIHQIATEKIPSLLQMYSRLKKKVQEINPDMMHAHCPRSLYLTVFLPKKYKRIYTIHIYPGLQQKVLYGTLKGNIVILLNHFFTRRMDLPIGCAESISTLYKKKKGWEIMSIPNGSSLPVWQEDALQKQQLREKFGLKKDVRYFIFIGRFSKEKNPDRLVEAFRMLNNKKIGLIMLGNGPMWDELKRSESEQILLPGFTTEVYNYLIASDYYISASEVEGLANTLLESMTIGLPVILSDIPSHQEVLSKMEKNVGYIIHQDQVSDIADKIEKIIHEVDRIEAATEIRRVFQTYYTAEKMSAAYQAAYLNLGAHNNSCSQAFL